MTSMEDLKAIAEAVKKDCVDKVESSECLKRALNIFDQYLATTGTFPSDPKARTYFFEDFTAEVVQSVSTLNVVTKPEYKETLKKLLQSAVGVLLAELSKDNKTIAHGMRPLFDPDSPLYEHGFGDLKNEIKQYLPPIDPKWREGLKVGTRLDVIKEEKIDVERLEGWAAATIKDIIGDTLYCTLDGALDGHSEIFFRNGNKIAPFGSRTNGWDWRDKLAPEDHIDIFDSQGKWYLGTVLEKSNDSKAGKMLYVGFRVYIPDGTKIDALGRKHEGWSAQYDSWISPNSIRIQRPNSITKMGTVYCRRTLDDESPAPDDSGDILLNYPVKDERIYVIHRFNKCYSTLYLDLMDAFGKSQGFDRIVERMKHSTDPASPLNIETLFSYIELMAAPYKLYHRTYVTEQIVPFVEAAMQYMSAIPEEQLRNVRKERLDLALARIDELMRRVFTAKTKGERLIKLKIDLSISLLRADQLERRIQAIRLIAETCKSAKASQEVYYQTNLPTANDSAVLSSLLKVPQIIDEIFGKRSHIELIQRSTEILKFVLLYSKITTKEFNVIWDCCEQDEQSKVEIFKVIADSSNLLPSELIELVIDKFMALAKSALKNQDVEIICELGGHFAQPSAKVQKQILDLMWEVVRGGVPSVSSEIVDKTMTKFCDMITTPTRVPEAIMREYFGQAYAMLEKGNNSMLALKLLRRSMVQLPVMVRFATREEMLSKLLEEGNAYKNFFVDIERYFATAKRRTEENCFKLMEHKDEVIERKDFLLFLIRQAKYKLAKADLDLLWQLLVQNRVHGEDQTVFYKLLKDWIQLGPIEDHVASLEDLDQFFTTVICSEKNNFQQLPFEGMQAIESLLISVNKAKGKIAEIGTIRRHKGNFLGPLIACGKDDGDNEEIEFRVKTLPTQIVGSGVLWQIVLEAKNEAVASKAIELVNKLYTKLADELEDRIAEISSNFVETAIEKLKIFHERMVNEKENRAGEIVKILRLIEEMLDDSERKGNGGITPLWGLGKGLPLLLKIQNFATDSIMNSQIPDKFELNVHSRITLWQLKVLVSKKLMIAPELLKLVVPGSETKDRDNGKMLEDLKVGDGDNIRATKRSEDFVARTALLSKQKLLTDKAKAVFSEVFERFSKDGKMLPIDCASFTRVCLSDRFVDANDYQVQYLFKEYDKEKKGHLTCDQFASFYESAAFDREDTVWNNLKELGYGPDLNRIDLSKPFVTTSATAYNKLPRYLLANNPNYFSLLLTLVKLGGEVGGVAWHLLYRLALSEAHLAKILAAFNGTEPLDWNAMFPATAPFESVYSLFIAEAMAGDSSEKDLAEIRREPMGDARDKLKLDIIQHKGIAWALSTVKGLRDKLAQPGMVTYAKMILDIAVVYIIAALKANGKIPKELKHFGYQQLREESKDPVAGTGDAEQARKAAKTVISSTSIAKAQSSVESEHLVPLADQYLVNYKGLCTVLTGDLGLSILDSVNYVELAQDSLALLNELVKHPNKNEEWLYLLQGVCMLVKGILIYKPELYEEVALAQDFGGILLRGLVCKDSLYLRDTFQQLAYFCVANVRPEKTALAKTPLGHLLVTMLDFDILLKEPECEELCALLSLMIDQYKPFEAKEAKLINTEEKLKEVLGYLKAYQSKETLNNGPPDNVLMGLLHLTAKLASVKEYARYLEAKERNDIVEEVFFHCLFPQKQATGELQAYKCKTSKSREAAYRLISSVVSYKGDCAQYLMGQCINPLRDRVSELTVWSYAPTAHERSPLGFVGLKNLGCICYINSMLQQFFMISPFRSAMITLSDGKPVAKNAEGIDDNLIHQMQRVFGYLMNSTRKDFVPSAFCYSLKESNGQPTNTAIQHDAQEFLNILFERLEKTLNDTPYRYLLQNVFGGKSCSQVVCSGCGYVSSIYEDYYTLSLEIKNQRTLADSLERFVAGSTVSEYLCGGCKKKVDATKRTLISTLPNVLIVHLQRFTFNFDTLMNEKIHTRLEFPSVLDMTQYTEEGSEKKEEEKKSKEIKKEEPVPAADETSGAMIKLQRKQSQMEEQEKELKEKAQAQARKQLKDKDYYVYKLVGVLVHSGNAEAGHYYSYINVARHESEDSPSYLKTEADRWLEFNDSNISEFGFSRVESECFGGSQEEILTGYMEDSSEVAKLIGGRSKSAYMLIYERKNKGLIPLKESVAKPGENDIVLSSLECDGTAVSRAEKEGRRVFGKDPANNELYTFHRFHRVPAIVPPELLSEVTMDNEKFLFEKLVYSKEFINFLCETYSNARIACECTSLLPLQSSLRPLLCNVADRFFFDIVAHANVSDLYCLAYIGDTMAKLFAADLESSKQLLHRLVHEPIRLFNLLVKCQENIVRTYVQKAVQAAFLRVATAEAQDSSKDSKLSRQLIDVLMSFIGYDLATQWTKFKQFFEVIREIVLSGVNGVVEYCLEKDFATTLLDFFLEKSSPVSAANTKRYEMGSSSQAPELGALIEFVSFLVLRTDLPGAKEGERLVPPTKVGSGSFLLSASALKCIQSDEFVPKHLRFGGKVAQVSKMIAHVCYKNRRSSKQACKIILKAINDFEVSKIPQYFDLLVELLTMEDEYQPLRIEWILGYQQPTVRAEYGLAAVVDIADEVNCYVSPLGVERKDDPLLQQLWSHRNRYEGFVAQCIKVLLQISAKCECLYEYLKAVPPPTYVFVRYTDWIPRFLDTYAKTTAFLTATEIKEKETLIGEIRVLYNAYQARVMKDPTPVAQLYLVGKTLETHELKDKEISQGGVRLVVTEIVTEVYPSKPMGTHNPALSGDFLIKHFNHYRCNANSNAEGSSMDKPKAGEPKAVINAVSMDQATRGADKDLDLESPHTHEERIEAPAANDVKPAEEKKSVDPILIPKPEEKESTDQEPKKLSVPEIVVISPSGSVQDAATAGTNITPSTADVPVTDFKKETEMHDMGKKSLELPEQNVAPDPVWIAIYHRIELVNSGYFSGFAAVAIRRKEGAKMNCYVPLSRCKCRIISCFNSTVYMLQKSFLKSEFMGEYELSLKLKDSAGKQVEASAVNKPVALPVPPPIHVPQPPPPPPEKIAGPEVISGGNVEDICCPFCTLKNPATASICDACYNSLVNVPGYRSSV